MLRGRPARGWSDRKGDFARWFARNRPTLEVAATFLAACLLGLAIASLGIASLVGGPAQAQPPAFSR